MLEYIRKREEPTSSRFYTTIVLQARRVAAAEACSVNAFEPVISVLADFDPSDRVIKSALKI
jgi:hypothetical protein